jgi:hypothetical protein
MAKSKSGVRNQAAFEARELLDERRQRAQSAREYAGSNPIDATTGTESATHYHWRTLHPNLSDPKFRSGRVTTS